MFADIFKQLPDVADKKQTWHHMKAAICGL